MKPMHLDVTAWCLDCDWVSDGDGADRAAERHTKAESHATCTLHTPPKAKPKPAGTPKGTAGDAPSTQP